MVEIISSWDFLDDFDDDDVDLESVFYALEGRSNYLSKLAMAYKIIKITKQNIKHLATFFNTCTPAELLDFEERLFMKHAELQNISVQNKNCSELMDLLEFEEPVNKQNGGEGSSQDAQKASALFAKLRNKVAKKNKTPSSPASEDSGLSHPSGASVSPADLIELLEFVPVKTQKKVVVAEKAEGESVAVAQPEIAPVAEIASSSEAPVANAVEEQQMEQVEPIVEHPQENNDMNGQQMEYNQQSQMYQQNQQMMQNGNQPPYQQVPLPFIPQFFYPYPPQQQQFYNQFVQDPNQQQMYDPRNNGQNYQGQQAAYYQMNQQMWLAHQHMQQNAMNMQPQMVMPPPNMSGPPRMQQNYMNYPPNMGMIPVPVQYAQPPNYGQQRPYQPRNHTGGQNPESRNVSAQMMKEVFTAIHKKEEKLQEECKIEEIAEVEQTEKKENVDDVIDNGQKVNESDQKEEITSVDSPTVPLTKEPNGINIINDDKKMQKAVVDRPKSGNVKVGKLTEPETGKVETERSEKGQEINNTKSSEEKGHSAKTIEKDQKNSVEKQLDVKKKEEAVDKSTADVASNSTNSREKKKNIGQQKQASKPAVEVVSKPAIEDTIRVPKEEVSDSKNTTIVSQTSLEGSQSDVAPQENKAIPPPNEEKKQNDDTTISSSSDKESVSIVDEPKKLSWAAITSAKKDAELQRLPQVVVPKPVVSKPVEPVHKKTDKRASNVSHGSSSYSRNEGNGQWKNGGNSNSTNQQKYKMNITKKDIEIVPVVKPASVETTAIPNEPKKTSWADIASKKPVEVKTDGNRKDGASNLPTEKESPIQFPKLGANAVDKPIETSNARKTSENKPKSQMPTSSSPHNATNNGNNQRGNQGEGRKKIEAPKNNSIIMAQQFKDQLEGAISKNDKKKSESQTDSKKEEKQDVVVVVPMNKDTAKPVANASNSKKTDASVPAAEKPTETTKTKSSETTVKNTDVKIEPEAEKIPATPPTEKKVCSVKNQDVNKVHPTENEAKKPNHTVIEMPEPEPQELVKNTSKAKETAVKKEPKPVEASRSSEEGSSSSSKKGRRKDETPAEYRKRREHASDMSQSKTSISNYLQVVKPKTLPIAAQQQTLFRSTETSSEEAMKMFLQVVGNDHPNRSSMLLCPPEPNLILQTIRNSVSGVDATLGKEERKEAVVQKDAVTTSQVTNSTTVDFRGVDMYNIDALKKIITVVTTNNDVDDLLNRQFPIKSLPSKTSEERELEKVRYYLASLVVPEKYSRALYKTIPRMKCDIHKLTKKDDSNATGKTCGTFSLEKDECTAQSHYTYNYYQTRDMDVVNEATGDLVMEYSKYHAHKEEDFKTMDVMRLAITFCARRRLEWMDGTNKVRDANLQPFATKCQANFVDMYTAFLANMTPEFAPYISFLIFARKTDEFDRLEETFSNMYQGGTFLF